MSEQKYIKLFEEFINEATAEEKLDKKKENELLTKYVHDYNKKRKSEKYHVIEGEIKSIDSNTFNFSDDRNKAIVIYNIILKTKNKGFNFEGFNFEDKSMKFEGLVDEKTYKEIKSNGGYKIGPVGIFDMVITLSV